MSDYAEQARRHLARHNLHPNLAPALVEAIAACRAGVDDHAVLLPDNTWTRAWDLVVLARAEGEVHDWY